MGRDVDGHGWTPGRYTCIHTCHVYTHTHIYIYPDGWVDVCDGCLPGTPLYIYLTLYIYLRISTYIYIYPYTHGHRHIDIFPLARVRPPRVVSCVPLRPPLSPLLAHGVRCVWDRVGLRQARGGGEGTPPGWPRVAWCARARGECRSGRQAGRQAAAAAAARARLEDGRGGPGGGRSSDMSPARIPSMRRVSE